VLTRLHHRALLSAWRATGPPDLERSTNPMIADNHKIAFYHYRGDPFPAGQLLQLGDFLGVVIEVNLPILDAILIQVVQ
jgi:hypothetical protein